jgi:glucose-1-phosphate cytidylyltransferase
MEITTMKVVLFCGGEGMRMREYSDVIPKPMVPLGYRPILWHIMRYYAHYGIRDFILCLGYRGDVIKEYFVDYKEWLSNDFVISRGGKKIQMLNRDIDDWNVTFVDTGRVANIGERLVAVRDHIGDDEVFLANYADVLTDVPLTALLEHFYRQDKIASFLAVRPSQTFHVVDIAANGQVQRLQLASEAGVWVNGGFFVLRRELFDYIRPGEELVLEPFSRLIAANQLTAFRHEGFWVGMDTFKERQALEEMYSKGRAPWAVWDGKRCGTARRAVADTPAAPSTTVAGLGPVLTVQ